MEKLNPEELIKKVKIKIDLTPEHEIKSDMKNIVCALVELVASEQPKILMKETPEDEMGKLFLKMIGSISMDAMNPFNTKKTKDKFSKILSLEPLLKKYSNE